MNRQIITVLIILVLAHSFALSGQVANQTVTVTLTEVADFQITSVPDKNVHINLANIDEDTTYSDGKYSLYHNSSNEKKVTAQVTAGPSALGIILKAELEKPAPTAESKGSVTILDGSATPLEAQVLLEKVPPGLFEDLALYYVARAGVTANVGANVFTVTFTIGE